MSDRRIEIIHDGRAVLAENGPMRLVIQAWEGDRPALKRLLESAEFAFECLEQVATYRPFLTARNPSALPLLREKGAFLAVEMIESVLLLDEPDLTPMAAVAGAIADAVADRLFTRDVTRVIVNNGGDISIRLTGDETARVGIRTDIRRPEMTHMMILDARHSSWGVNTSGLGGRSLTRGIASGVTVTANRSARADAAATALANACYAHDDAIVQVPAETMDPGTDIPGIPVTVQVGQLQETTVALALESARIRAENYVTSNYVYGALISVGGETISTSSFETRVSTLET